MPKVPFQILPIIVIAQFCCTSLWFAGNAVMPELIQNFDLPVTAMGHLTSAVQLGFILGSLIFAFFTLSDRYSPSRLFFFSALAGALFNLGILWQDNNLISLIILRFLTGLALAGIYPVGMKIAADYYREGLGRSLGFLVGALVLGTAFPHLIKEVTGKIEFKWDYVILTTSLLSLLGGIFILLFIKDGPLIMRRTTPDFKLVSKIFRNRKFKSAAFAYFGHMWELYTFWAFIPVILILYREVHPSVHFSISFFSFLIIGAGALGCVIAGFISEKAGVKKTAGAALLLSGLCCLLSPFILIQNSEEILVMFLILWGIMVVADSPLFSTLVARNTDPESRGTALTIVNGIGFLITIFSIQIFSFISEFIDLYLLLPILALGPVFGLFHLLKTPRRI
ncbi:MFS transporter [Christiangramia aquimixticola]|uniref:MFS transporter n=1 Tax=Christiangramia aquimixticola TaxID=1697558 RepID=UPI003AA7C06B